jgi:hypothetical protein
LKAKGENNFHFVNVRNAMNIKFNMWQLNYKIQDLKTKALTKKTKMHFQKLKSNMFVWNFKMKVHVQNSKPQDYNVCSKL